MSLVIKAVSERVKEFVRPSSRGDQSSSNGSELRPKILRSATWNASALLIGILLLASFMAGCSTGNGGVGLDGAIGKLVDPPAPSPTAPAPTVFETPMPSATTANFTLQTSNGYYGALTMTTSSQVPSGVQIVTAAYVQNAPGAPAAQAYLKRTTTGFVQEQSSAPTAVANWLVGFTNWSGTANVPLQNFPTVTLTVLNAANAVVEIFDSTESGSAPVVLYPQLGLTSGLVTFQVSPTATSLANYFLFTDKYWVLLVTGSAVAAPSPSPTAAS